jgi:hypothetical protein
MFDDRILQLVEQVAKRLAQRHSVLARRFEFAADINGSDATPLDEKPKPPGDWITVPEAMDIAGRSDTTIRKWVKKERIEQYQRGAGATVKIDRASLLKWCAILGVKVRIGTP